MISNAIVNVGSFICCAGYQSPNETVVYYNDNNGHYHAQLYVIEGTMEVFASDTETPIGDSQLSTPEVGVLYDISHTRGKYITSKTKSGGASFVTFNPVPADRKLDIEVLTGKQTIEVNAIGSRTTVFCLTGPIKVNDKILKSTQFAVVFENKSATLTMEENTICALIKS